MGLLLSPRCCKLLERQLWTQYRRGSDASFTPLLVALSACKDPAKSAVEEQLREVGLDSLSQLQSRSANSTRRWLVVMDGYDEVQGAVNFIVGNKLHECSRVKVWCRVVRCGAVWCGVIPCGAVWCGAVWCGVVRCGVVWCSVVRCGAVWCDMLTPMQAFTPHAWWCVYTPEYTSARVNGRLVEFTCEFRFSTLSSCK